MLVDGVIQLGGNWAYDSLQIGNLGSHRSGRAHLNLGTFLGTEVNCWCAMSS